MKAIRLIISALLTFSIIPGFSQESAFKEEFQIIKKHKATSSKNGWVYFNQQVDLNNLLKDFDDRA